MNFLSLVFASWVTVMAMAMATATIFASDDYQY
jgi:hypothetical protein